MAEVVVVIAGGDEPSSDTYAHLPASSRVVCADKGLDYALRQGLSVDVCVGDFDSVDPHMLAKAEAARIELRTHDEDKDQTDLELALLAALEFDPVEVIVVGIGGGRLDHFFGNLLLLANPAFTATVITAVVGSALVSVVQATRTLHGTIGENVSLFAVRGDASGVTLTGFDYPLVNATLKGSSSRGVSNKFSSGEAVVSVETGVLVVIQPDGFTGPLGTPAP